MRETTIQRIRSGKIIAIIRGMEDNTCLKIAEALYAGGIDMIEVTYNHKDPDSYKNTATAIRAICDEFAGAVLAGAGTVTTPDLVDLSAESGAKYIISPDVNPAVIKRTRELELVSMPGALTATEILAAYAIGADFVKLFPISNFGPSYVKALRAPISHVPMLAVGGINIDNFKEYLDAGCLGAGIGGELVNKEWVSSGEFGKITKLAKQLKAIAKGD